MARFIGRILFFCLLVGVLPDGDVSNVLRAEHGSSPALAYNTDSSTLSEFLAIDSFEPLEVCFALTSLQVDLSAISSLRVLSIQGARTPSSLYLALFHTRGPPHIS